MNAKRFSPERIVHGLRETETSKLPVGEFCRQPGIGGATLHRWRQRFSGMEAAEVRQWRELSSENTRLKRLVAERDLEVDALRQLIEKTL